MVLALVQVPGILQQGTWPQSLMEGPQSRRSRESRGRTVGFKGRDWAGFASIRDCVEWETICVPAVSFRLQYRQARYPYWLRDCCAAVTC